MTETLPEPTLGRALIGDQHERKVRIIVIGAPPMKANYLRGGREVQFQPDTLYLAYEDTPARLVACTLSGRDLNKNGQPNARGITSSYSFMTRVDTSYRTEDGGWVIQYDRALDDDTPGWIRNLIAQYEPDWPELPTVES